MNASQASALTRSLPGIPYRIRVYLMRPWSLVVTCNLSTLSLSTLHAIESLPGTQSPRTVGRRTLSRERGLSLFFIFRFLNRTPNPTQTMDTDFIRRRKIISRFYVLWDAVALSLSIIIAATDLAARIDHLLWTNKLQ